MIKYAFRTYNFHELGMAFFAGMFLAILLMMLVRFLDEVDKTN